MGYKLDYKVIFDHMKFEFVEKLKQFVPKHDGDLSKSISADVFGTDSEVTLEVYMLSYWYYVEYGSAPHWTSVDNLKKWAKDKLGDENLAYALQKHIAKYGTKPHPFVRKVIDEYFFDMLYNSIKSLGAKALKKNTSL